MSNYLDRIQELSERREIPPKLVVFLTQVLCDDDEDVGMTHVCEQDAKLMLSVLYGWQQNASPSQPCPICGLIDDTCPYHRGVDDAIEADLAAGLRAAVRRRRGILPRRTAREWLWLLIGASVVVGGCGLADPYQRPSDLWFAIAGLLGLAVGLFGMGIHLLLPLVRNTSR